MEKQGVGIARFAVDYDFDGRRQSGDIMSSEAAIPK
jgi:hypothetical protein